MFRDLQMSRLGLLSKFERLVSVSSRLVSGLELVPIPVHR